MTLEQENAKLKQFILTFADGYDKSVHKGNSRIVNIFYGYAVSARMLLRFLEKDKNDTKKNT